MTDTKTLAVAGGLGLAGLWLATRNDGSGSGAAGFAGWNQQRQDDDDGGDGGDGGGLADDSDSLALGDHIDSIEEFDPEEHGDLFDVTGTVDEDFGSDGSLSPDADTSGTPFDSPYEAELLDDDTGD